MIEPGPSRLKPFNSVIDLESGRLNPQGMRIVRRLSQMKGMYHDSKAEAELIEEDPVVYEFFNVDIPEEPGHLQHCLSIIYPGKVGDEYFMTKGHYHAKAGTAEVYVCLKGHGWLLMQTEDGEFESLEMYPGTVSYIPPYWAHRTVNTGDEPFVFFGAYPGEAGHNYGSIEEKGFARLMVCLDGKPQLIDNPKYKGLCLISRGGH